MITVMEDVLQSLNGRITGLSSVDSLVKDKIACAVSSDTLWSCCENNANNAMYVRMSDGNTNNNNKTNSYVVRAVAALGEEELTGWVDAFIDCLRHKRSSKDCADYIVGNFEWDLWLLIYEVSVRIYKPGRSKCFLVTRPRLREVFAAYFRDRIAQHWARLRIEPLMEERYRSMGNVTFNCRKGFGSWKAIEALRRYSLPGYYIGKYDLQGFFMSIDIGILLKLVSRFIGERYTGKDKDALLWLIEVIILYRPEKNCIRRSPKEMWKDLPANKSLFGSDGRHGIAIGNVTSQEFANFLMSFFDELFCFAVKDILGLDASHLAAYIRFVDDFAVISDSKQWLVKLRSRMMEWLKDHLHLTLHPDKVYLQKADRSAKFLGTVIKSGRVYTSKEMVGKAYDAFRALEEASMYCYHFPTIDNAKRLEKAVCTVNSYLGSMSHTMSYGIRRKLFKNLTWTWKCCYVGNRFTVVKIHKRYTLRKVLILKANIEYETSKREIEARTRYSHACVRTAKAKHRGKRRRERRRDIRLRGNRTSCECLGA